MVSSPMFRDNGVWIPAQGRNDGEVEALYVIPNPPKADEESKKLVFKSKSLDSSLRSE